MPQEQIRHEKVSGNEVIPEMKGYLKPSHSAISPTSEHVPMSVQKICRPLFLSIFCLMSEKEDSNHKSLNEVFDNETSRCETLCGTVLGFFFQNCMYFYNMVIKWIKSIILCFLLLSSETTATMRWLWHKYTTTLPGTYVYVQLIPVNIFE